jgi:hypothetical protein
MQRPRGRKIEGFRDRRRAPPVQPLRGRQNQSRMGRSENLSTCAVQRWPCRRNRHIAPRRSPVDQSGSLLASRICWRVGQRKNQDDVFSKNRLSRHSEDDRTRWRGTRSTLSAIVGRLVARVPCGAASQLLCGRVGFGDEARQLNQQAARHSDRIVLLREGVDELVEELLSTRGDGGDHLVGRVSRSRRQTRANPTVRSTFRSLWRATTTGHVRKAASDADYTPPSNCWEERDFIRR